MSTPPLAYPTVGEYWRDVEIGLREVGNSNAGFRVATLNINGFDNDKCEMLIRRMFFYKIDIYMVQDTRLDENGSKFARQLAVRRFGEIYKVDGGRLLYSAHEGGSNRHDRVGGAFAILSPSIIGVKVDLEKCTTGLGVHFGIVLRSRKLVIYGVYWPFRNGGQESLQSKVLLWMILLLHLVGFCLVLICLEPLSNVGKVTFMLPSGFI